MALPAAWAKQGLDETKVGVQLWPGVPQLVVLSCLKSPHLTPSSHSPARGGSPEPGRGQLVGRDSGSGISPKAAEQQEVGKQAGKRQAMLKAYLLLLLGISRSSIHLLLPET